MHFLAERVRHNWNNLPKDMVVYPSFAVIVRRLNYRNRECQAETEGWFFLVHVLQKIKQHEHHGLSQPQKSMNDSRSQAGAPNIGNPSGHAWVTQSPFIWHQTLISVFLLSAACKMEFLIVWRARDGQVGEGIIEMVHPSSGGPQCIRDNVLRSILAPLLFLLFKVQQDILISI